MNNKRTNKEIDKWGASTFAHPAINCITRYSYSLRYSVIIPCHPITTLSCPFETLRLILDIIMGYQGVIAKIQSLYFIIIIQKQCHYYSIHMDYEITIPWYEAVIMMFHTKQWVLRLWSLVIISRIKPFCGPFLPAACRNDDISPHNVKGIQHVIMPMVPDPCVYYITSFLFTVCFHSFR